MTKHIQYDERCTCDACRARRNINDPMQQVLSLLKELEWSGRTAGPGSGPHGSGGDGELYAACPMCGGLQESNPSFMSTAVGHRSRCKLAVTLRKVREIVEVA